MENGVFRKVHIKEIYMESEGADRDIRNIRRDHGAVIEEIKKRKEGTSARDMIIPSHLPSRDLRMKLVNYERNREYLKRVPHRRMLDLAAVCYICVDVPGSGEGTCDVTNELRALWDVTEEELFRQAEAGTRRWDPPEYEEIGEALENFGVRMSISDDEFQDDYLYVLTVMSRINGAVCLMFPDFLNLLAVKFESDLFLIPSSIHEILALPDRGDFTKEELDRMVREVNRSHVLPEEVLSNHVYRFDLVKEMVLAE